MSKCMTQSLVCFEELKRGWNYYSHNIFLQKLQTDTQKRFDIKYNIKF